MQIDWVVVALEALNFGVLVVILRRFVFRPAIAVLEKRRAEIERGRLDAEAREAAADAVRTDYDQRLVSLDELARSKMRESEAEANRRAGLILDEARAEAQRQSAATDAECETARRRALESVRREVAVLASAAAARVVQRVGGEDVALAFVRRGAHALQAACEEESFGHEEVLTVALGEDADPDAAVDVLKSVLGDHLELRVEVDPTIVSGVRLMMGGHEVEASASATLRQWYVRHVDAFVADQPALLVGS